MFSKKPIALWLISDSCLPIDEIMIVVLYKNDRSGRTRYYTLHDRQGNLFSPYSLSILWGNAPGAGREREYVFTSGKDKERMIRTRIRKRLRSGYHHLYSFSRKPEERRFLRQEVINL